MKNYIQYDGAIQYPLLHDNTVFREYQISKYKPYGIYKKNTHQYLPSHNGNVDRDLDQGKNLIEVYHKSIMNNQYILSRITIIQVVLNF